MTYKRYIICAAVKINGQVYLGNNHGDILQNIIFKKGEKATFDTQGFVDNMGNFLSRVEAHKVAKEAGQIDFEADPDTVNPLRSEHLDNKLWLLKDIQPDKPIIYEER